MRAGGRMTISYTLARTSDNRYCLSVTRKANNHTTKQFGRISKIRCSGNRIKFEFEPESGATTTLSGKDRVLFPNGFLVHPPHIGNEPNLRAILQSVYDEDGLACLDESEKPRGRIKWSFMEIYLALKDGGILLTNRRNFVAVKCVGPRKEQLRVVYNGKCQTISWSQVNRLANLGELKQLYVPNTTTRFNYQDSELGSEVLPVNELLHILAPLEDLESKFRKINIRVSVIIRGSQVGWITPEDYKKLQRAPIAEPVVQAADPSVEENKSAHSVHAELEQETTEKNTKHENADDLAAFVAPLDKAELDCFFAATEKPNGAPDQKEEELPAFWSHSAPG